MTTFTGRGAVASLLSEIKRVLFARSTLTRAHEPPHDDGVVDPGCERLAVPDPKTDPLSMGAVEGARLLGRVELHADAGQGGISVGGEGLIVRGGWGSVSRFDGGGERRVGLRRERE